MCGIFGYVGEREDAATLVLDGLKKLDYRGYDSWGIAVASGGATVVDKRLHKIGDASTALPPSHAGIGHTRWATHGGVTRANAHPHLDCSGRLAIVHNGIVDNHVELRRELLQRGHRLRSETDTELIAHLVEEALAAAETQDSLLRATITAFRRLQGLNCIVVLDARTGELAAAKSGSPLLVGLDDSACYMASDQAALLEHTRRVAFVEEGRAVWSRGGETALVDVQTGLRCPLNAVTIECEASGVELRGHPDFMSKEISEQPRVLRRLATDRSGWAAVRDLATRIAASSEVIAVGCGSAGYAALAAQHALVRAGRRVRAVAASEYAAVERLVGPETLLLAISQSGETIDVLEAVRSAKARGANIAALTNVPSSSLARLSDFTLALGAGPERCVVATKSLTAKLAVLLLTASALEGDLEAAAERVLRAADAAEALLQATSRAQIREIAAALQRARHLFVLGRGASHALALESALKIKEVSYLHAEGFAGGELKHGVIALVEPGTPCMVLAPNDATLPDILSNAMQVKARGALVLGIAPVRHEVFDLFIQVPDLGDATAIVNALPAQLLGYELARFRGHDPDMPRNLAKSVTVK